MIRTYWHRVHRSALDQSLRILKLRPLDARGWFFIFVTLALLWLVGATNVVGHEVLLKIASAAVILATFPVLYVWHFIATPARLDNQTQKEIENLRARLQSDITLIFNEAAYGIEIIKDGPLKQVVSICVKNGGGVLLEQCQLQLQLIARQGVKMRADTRIVVSRPFSLRPDEPKAISIFSYDFDDPKAPITITHFAEIDNEWVEHPGRIKLIPGAYDIGVEALSANSRLARLDITLTHDNNGWQIQGQRRAPAS